LEKIPLPMSGVASTQQLPLKNPPFGNEALYAPGLQKDHQSSLSAVGPPQTPPSIHHVVLACRVSYFPNAFTPPRLRIIFLGPGCLYIPRIVSWLVTLSFFFRALPLPHHLFLGGGGRKSFNSPVKTFLRGGGWEGRKHTNSRVFFWVNIIARGVAWGGGFGPIEGGW